jgi:hypothetical protein
LSRYRLTCSEEQASGQRRDRQTGSDDMPVHDVSFQGELGVDFD